MVRYAFLVWVGVVLQGCGSSRVTEGTLSGDTTWADGQVVTGDLSIVDGTMSVAPCATVEIAPGATITVGDGGALRAVGDGECPITFTAEGGRWDGIVFTGGSNGDGNALEHAIVEHAGAGDVPSVLLEEGAAARIRDTIVRDGLGSGVEVREGAEIPDFTGNEVVDNGGCGIVVDPDRVPAIGEGTYSPNGEEGICVLPGFVTADATWPDHGLFYRVDELAIEGDDSAILTIGAGLELVMEWGKSIYVGRNGGLTLAGTAGEPVVLRQRALPEGGLGDVFWGRLEFGGDSVPTGNRIEHALLEGGGSAGPDSATIWLYPGASVAITDSTIRDGVGAGIASYGVSMDHRGIELRNFTGNTVTGHHGPPIRLDASFVDQIGPGTYSPNREEGIRVDHGWVDHDATWHDRGVPYVSEDGFEIGFWDDSPGSATLTVGAGVTLEFGRWTQTFAINGGHLVLAGTADRRVRVTSSSATPAAGDWGSIVLLTDGNSFAHADIEYGGMNDPSEPSPQVIVDGGLDLDDVVFAHAASCDILLSGGSLTATDSTYTLCD